MLRLTQLPGLEASVVAATAYPCYWIEVMVGNDFSHSLHGPRFLQILISVVVAGGEEEARD
jgi:hypothetical protein